jgi:acetolactate synthase-1/3 small subunit
MFSRRRIQLESLNVASTEVEGIHRFTIVVIETEEVIQKLMRQIDKQVDVFKTFFHPDEDVVWQEQVLFQVSNTNDELEALVKPLGARCISVHRAYRVFEVTGTPETLRPVNKVLQLFSVPQMVKGGRIAICSANQEIHKKLHQIASFNTQSPVECNVAQ